MICSGPVSSGVVVLAEKENKASQEACRGSVPGILQSGVIAVEPRHSGEIHSLAEGVRNGQTQPPSQRRGVRVIVRARPQDDVLYRRPATGVRYRIEHDCIGRRACSTDLPWFQLRASALFEPLKPCFGAGRNL